MSVIEFVVYLVVAGICGAVARAIAGGSSGGFIISVGVGFVGAFIGTWLARTLRLPEPFAVNIGGYAFPIVWSIAGGFLLVVLAHLLMRRRSYLGQWHAR